MTDERADYLMRLIRCRVPEATEADLAAISQHNLAEDETLPTAVGEQILEVLDLMMARLDRLEEKVANRL
jgi:hypothetical protein